MSVKLYKGMIGTSTDTFQVATDVREVLELEFYKKFDYLKGTAEDYRNVNPGGLWSDAFDGFYGTGPLASLLKNPIPDNESVVIRELHEIIVEIDKVKSLTFSDLDIGYELMFFPNGMGPTDPPLILVFGALDKYYTDQLIQSGVVEAWPYWDNTDAPDDISAWDWDYRRESWTSLTDGSKTFAQVGLKVDYPSYEDVFVRYVLLRQKQNADTLEV